MELAPDFRRTVSILPARSHQGGPSDRCDLRYVEQRSINEGETRTSPGLRRT